MKRNAGIIGLQQLSNFRNSGLSGTFDIFDQLNIKREGDWPQTKQVSSIDINDTTPNEGTSVILTINTEGFFNDDVLYYSIETVAGSVTSDDFSDGALTGSFIISDDQGEISKLLTASETLTEPNDAFLVRIRKDSVSGTILATSSTIYIQDTIATADWRSPSSNVGSNSTTTANPINIYYRRTVFKMTYSSTIMDAMAGGGSIEKLRLYVTNPLASPRIPLPNYTVSLKNIAVGAQSSNPGSSGWTIVWNSTLSPTSVGYYEWNITNFSYTGGGLALCFAFGQCPYGWTADGQTYIFSDSGNAYAWYSRSDGTGYYTNSSTAYYAYNNYVPIVELYY